MVATRRRGEGRSAVAIPDATVARLPLYLRTLLAVTGAESTVSSGTLAAAAGVTPAQLRKDLSYLGSYGTRGVGYDVDYLTAEISRTIGLSTERAVVIVGIGNLGQALAKYAGFGSRGFHIAGLLDDDPALIGTPLRIGDRDLAVRPFSDLAAVVAAQTVSIGVIAVPAAAAQGVCDAFVAAGVRSILNFAPCVLSVPSGVSVRQVDLASELQILAFHDHHMTVAEPVEALINGRGSARVNGDEAPSLSGVDHPVSEMLSNQLGGSR
jgi:redox-sensing transcriptional repressor